MPGESLGVKCRRGHDDWVFSADGGKRCRICRNKNRNKTFGTGLTPGYRGPLGVTCKRGHDNWTVDKTARKRCWTCKNGYRRPSWHSRREDEQGRQHYDLGSPTTLLWDTLTWSEVMEARKDPAAV